jgi:lipoprotein NlpI
MKRLFPILLVVFVSCQGQGKNDKSNSTKELLERGFQSDAQENYRNSIRVYDSVLEKESGNYIALVNRGRAKIFLGDTTSGMLDLLASIRTHPTPQAFASRAMVEFNTNPPQAVVDLQTGNKTFPGQSLLTSLLAHYYTAIDPLRDSAIYYADYTCKLSISTPTIYFPLMNAYLYFNDYINLLRISDSIIAYFPKFPYAYNNRGMAELYLGNLTASKRDIQTSIDLDSTNAWAYRNMSLFFEKIHEPDSSCRYIGIARQMDKKQQYQKDIDSLVLKFCSNR